MAEFVRTSSGFINLAHVMLIKVGVDREAGEDDLIQFHDGRTIHCRIEDRSFLPQPAPTPTPTSTPTVAVIQL
jgi:hypothetical protein